MPSQSTSWRTAVTAYGLLLLSAVVIAAVTGEAQAAIPDTGRAPANRPAGTTPGTVLFSDTFSRPNNETIGKGWIENEVRGARGAIEDQRLCFVETSDQAVYPQVLHDFDGAQDSGLEWKFAFDWDRTGPETAYQLFMQLGDGTLMTPDDPHRGVAVNLAWTTIDGIHESLGYYHGGELAPLAVLSGQADLTVIADPTTRTYEVRIDRTSIASGLPFDTAVAMNTIRLFTSHLDGANFRGRCFDSLVLSRNEANALARPKSTPTATRTGRATSSATVPATATATPASAAKSTSTPSAELTPSSSPTIFASPTSVPGAYPQWTRVELTLPGPGSVGMSDTANPFEVVADVTFTAPDGTQFLVPAFYDGDGRGGMDGNVWRVRFAPSQAGTWNYRSQSREPLLDGQAGTFEVSPPSGCSPYQPGDLPDFGCLGRLGYTGGHFLQFAAGPYWLKGGVDDPEDFLAPGNTVGFASREAAIDYLASHGVNSLYLLLHNIGGDGQNVWPWAGGTQAEAQVYHEHFNLAKLAEWEMVFGYLQAKGIVLHLVLEDDSAWTGFHRGLYYRQMVARFAHHPGLIWNLAEEYNETYTASQIQTFAGLLSALDPYDHPITVHHAGGLSSWDPFVGHPDFDLTSFQTSDKPQHEAAVSWFSSMEDAPRTIPISFDETGKVSADERDLARHIAWSIYLGGGNFELHASPLASYQDFDLHFEDLTRARTFMETLPFCEMRPMSERLLNGQAYAAGRDQDVLVVYLPNGGSVELDLRPATGLLHGTWFEPVSGSASAMFSTNGGGQQTFTSPFPGESVLTLLREGTDLSTCR